MLRRHTVPVLATLAVLILLSFSLSVSPLSTFSASGDLPDWIDDVYLHFDSLRTDLSEYRWPTDASYTMSSAFAEFRKTHFHAGIDISTNGRTGYRVFASRSGSIARIMVSPFGYGKMLQVRHDDGFTTVYAHLQKFNDEIERFVRARQYDEGRYSVDIRPDAEQFPVEQGDVIAYTGDTGVGPPHLHFEIRDERMNPVNPLLGSEFDAVVADTRHPEFLQISVAPFDYTGRINGTARPVMMDARHRGNHRYTVGSVIRIAGPVGISVKAVDRVNATWHRNGVYQYELYLDSTLIFTSKLDRFSARESEQIALHYDWPLVLAGEGRFQKLFLEPGNRLPLYSRYAERSGVLEPTPGTIGEHEIRIVARDIKGNAAQLTAAVVFEEVPTIDVRRIDRHYVLTPPVRPDLTSIMVSSKLPGSKRWSVRRVDPSLLASGSGGLVLPLEEADRRLVRVVGTHADGSTSYPVYFAPEILAKTDNSLSLATEFTRDYLLVTVSSHLPFSLRPTLWLLNGSSKTLMDINAADERTYLGTLPLASLSGGTARLEATGIVNGTSVEAVREFTIFPITPEEGGTIVAGDGEFAAEFPPLGVYQQMYCRVERDGPAYILSPHDLLLNRGATIRFRVPPGMDSARAALFYAHDGDLSLLSSRIEDGYFVGHVRRFLGTFTVETDAVPPEISGLTVRYANGRLRIRFNIQDRRSGVHPDKIRVTVNDRLLIGEYDPYSRRVVFDEPFVLEPGSHVLRIEASDRIGNTSVAARSFRTSANP